mmetsp:Transcript_45920/g.142102  ORF Transcript_45920/g.142102 Transcript_45920/m.142102 type:complete len:223 (+) Transcript_45920:1284-1952(+)
MAARWSLQSLQRRKGQTSRPLLKHCGQPSVSTWRRLGPLWTSTASIGCRSKTSSLVHASLASRVTPGFCLEGLIHLGLAACGTMSLTTSKWSRALAPGSSRTAGARWRSLSTGCRDGWAASRSLSRCWASPARTRRSAWATWLFALLPLDSRGMLCWPPLASQGKMGARQSPRRPSWHCLCQTWPRLSRLTPGARRHRGPGHRLGGPAPSRCGRMAWRISRQ